MTALEHVEGAAGALKVFPLPSVVLFPGMILPLHIFEPRYRQMVSEALQSDKVIAIAQLEVSPEGSATEPPTIRPLCCAGILIWHQGLGEGRYNVILQGVARARILQELPTRKLYREVSAQILRDPAFSGPEEGQLRQAVFELAGRLPQEVSESLLRSAARAAGGELADIVAAAVVGDVERRQALLGELSVKQRLSSVVDDVGVLIARLGASSPRGPLN